MKKMISAMLAAAMLIPAVPSPAAEAALSPEDAIVLVKEAIDVPEELSEFSYNDYEGGYELRWSKPDGSGSLQATVTKDGLITEYSRYDDNEAERGLSTVRRAALWQSAKDFVGRTAPEAAASLTLDEENSTGRRAAFVRRENGARVEDNGASVYFNRQSGKVRDYSLSYDTENTFSGSASLTPEQGLEALAEGALKLEYHTFWPEYTDAEAEAKPVAFPIYVPQNGLRADAADGSIFERGYFRSSIFNSSASMDMDAAAEEYSGGGSNAGQALRKSLSPKEQAAVEAMKGLISKDDIAARLRALPELDLPAEYDLSVNYYSYTKGAETTYYASARCEWGADEARGSADIRFDGISGELKSVDISYDDMWSVPENPVSDEDCARAATSFMAKTRDLSAYAETNNGAGSKTFFRKSWQRVIGGIPYPDDSKSVNVSKRTGKVVYFSESDPEAEIITPASMVSALEAAKNNFTAELVYSYSAEGKPVLSYALKPNADLYAVKAEDGSAIDYTGAAPEAAAEKPAEKEHWAWPFYDILRENDIYVPGGYSFDDNIACDDFMSLVRQAINISNMPSRYYYFETGGADVDRERNSDVPSREGAAELIMTALGWKPLVGLDVFAVKFADEADFVGGVGGAAVLQGLGIMSGDGGSFAPRRPLTYGEAYAAAYNLAVQGLGGDEPMPLIKD